MQIKSTRVRGDKRLRRLGGELSREAKVRLAWMDFSQAHGDAVTLTCRHFGISRQTFYRWRRRYDPRRLGSLESGSHRPKRPRTPAWTRELVLAVLHQREQHPRWGKDKLAVLLRQNGHTVSTSKVGRILPRWEGSWPT